MLLLILTFPDELKAIVTNLVPITYRTKVKSILRDNPQSPSSDRESTTFNFRFFSKKR